MKLHLNYDISCNLIFCIFSRGISTSFEGKHGSIRYWLKAEMDKPWSFNHKTKRAFTVISPIDINKPEYQVHIFPMVPNGVRFQEKPTFISGNTDIPLPCFDMRRLPGGLTLSYQFRFKKIQVLYAAYVFRCRCSDPCFTALQSHQPVIY